VCAGKGRGCGGWGRVGCAVWVVWKCGGGKQGSVWGVGWWVWDPNWEGKVPCGKVGGQCEREGVAMAECGMYRCEGSGKEAETQKGKVVHRVVEVICVQMYK